MGVEKQETHRPGGFKQVNKPHKTGRHRSKGSIGHEVGGRIGVKALTKRARQELGKEARRHQSQQLRQKKREAVLAKKRNLGGSSSAPILVAVIPLHEDLNPKDIVNCMKHADESAIVTVSPNDNTHISLPRYKQRFTFVTPPVGNTFATLDAAKVANTVLFVVSATTGHSTDSKTDIVDSWGEEIIVACLAQGLPSTIIGLINLEDIPIKKRQDYKQQAQKTISKWLPQEKVHSLDKPTDTLNILRRAGSQKQRNVAYRNKRAHLLAEQIKYTCNSDAENYVGTLEVSGYLRGIPLSVNGLVHVPGLGDFQMSQIDAPEDPHPLEKRELKGRSTVQEDSMESEVPTKVLERADPSKQESLQSENVIDPMDAEQTWPTEEELAEAEMERKRKLIKRVPKGTSEYQAAWIPDDDADEFDNSASESEDDCMSVEAAQSEEDSVANDDKDEEYETMTVSEAAPDEQRYDEEMDLHEERQAMEKIKQAKLDAEFPDEIDTPQDVLAKVRFQKYRGLESFKTSPWDPKENLPIDYARIFQFQNFDRTRRRIFKEQQDVEGAMPGWYVTLHIIGVKKELFDAYRTAEDLPLVVFGLLPHENKMSVLNAVLKRTSNNAEPIKSKERLIFQCGFRRLSSCPIFSQHTNGNKHKYERYFQPESTVVASMFAPIMFPPCPVLCYTTKMELIAIGSVLSANPDRIVIKRVALSGHPFKVHKRSAVIRFMFYNRDDINWFKPVELHTKYGRRGHIREPLGTHGHMKCVFDGQLKSQDTVLMNLYKRVFPKWTYEPFLFTDEMYQSNDVNIQ
ncbi:pre-rRNA-processing protein TSR1 homolog [Orussus abietinus]|uniref:pre-rRNA-processing protein TSR1 homolog n=1 Tax=Orussus abietinus TaxID=222816 RepID=UPI0006265ABE|nr:pre-rRNA-processing protein TSR1 homolog [Orussus abietinus]